MPYTDDEIRVSIEFEMGNRFLIGVFEPWLAAHDAEARADEREKAAQRVYTRAREIAEANLKREHRVDTISTWILLAAAARGEDNSRE